VARPPILSRPDFETTLAKLAGVPLTLALLDVDHFKNLNDTLGHNEGDRVLRVVERLLTGSLPAGSHVARLGGDEYAAILPETAAETALILFDEIIKHFQMNRDPDWPRTLSLSVGLAGRPPTPTAPSNCSAPPTRPSCAPNARDVAVPASTWKARWSSRATTTPRASWSG